MERIKDELAKLNITPKKVGAAVIIHEIIGATVLFGSWFVCYKLLRHSPATSRVLERFQRHKAYQNGRKWSARKFSFLPRYFTALHPECFMVAGAVSTVARKAAAPLLVPAKVVAAVGIVRVLTADASDGSKT